MILVNSCDLLRLDLDGVHVLLPHLVSALEAVLPEKELRLRPTTVQKNELRRAGINLLISMLALPSQFQVGKKAKKSVKLLILLALPLQALPIKDLVPGLSAVHDPHSFSSLKPRMVNLLANALQVESEAVNTQLLLGGLMFMVQDTATLEQMELEKVGGGGSNQNGEMNRMSNGMRRVSRC